jgi:hypothetical protein
MSQTRPMKAAAIDRFGGIETITLQTLQQRCHSRRRGQRFGGIETITLQTLPTFIVQHGKIVTQTFVGKISSK